MLIYYKPNKLAKVKVSFMLKKDEEYMAMKKESI